MNSSTCNLNYRVQTLVGRHNKFFLAAIFSLIVFSHSATIAQGGVLISVVESSGDVLITASGTINLGDLTMQGNVFTFSNGINPRNGVFALGVGTTGNIPVDVGDTYSAKVGDRISHPSNFGRGNGTSPASASGLIFGFLMGAGGIGDGIPDLIQVPNGYRSGSQINSSARFANTTIADLGLRPGQYSWTWGSGPNADSITMDIPGTFADFFPTLDPDEDDNQNGISNFVEYATGFDPMASVSPALVSPSISSNFTLTFRKRNNGSDVDPVWQKSSALRPESWGGMILGTDYTIVSTTTEGEQDVTTLQLLLDPSTDPKMFFRQLFRTSP